MTPLARLWLINVLYHVITGSSASLAMKRHAGIDAAEQLAEDRGIRCVVLDYDAMAGTEREGTLC